jgi:hypothetical protein
MDMDAATTASPQQDSRPDAAGLQYEEVAGHRTAILNRELVRLRQEGWDVRLDGDQLVASCSGHGRSQLERTLIAVLAALVQAYAATIVAADSVAELPLGRPEFFVAAALLGALAAFLSRGQAAHARRITVAVDGQGRPFVTEQASG